MEDGYTLFDYDVALNSLVQFMIKAAPPPISEVKFVFKTVFIIIFDFFFRLSKKLKKNNPLKKFLKTNYQMLTVELMTIKMYKLKLVIKIYKFIALFL